MNRNNLPIFGGAGGGVSSAFFDFNLIGLPVEKILHTIILAAVGAIVGYFIKMLLDKIFKKKTSNNE